MPQISEENLTLPQIFHSRAVHYKKREGLRYKRKEDGSFTPISWEHWLGLVQKSALGLYSLGVRRHDKVAILAENRPEWTYADLGALTLGASVVPIYPTSSPQDVSYILMNAEVEILFISTQEQLIRVKEAIQGNSKIRWIITMDEASSSDARVMKMETLLKRGGEELAKDPEAYKRFLEIGDPEDIATIIYTSGTTGPPKGVMLTHRNFVANYLGSKEKIHLNDKDVALSFLPLSHVFERLAGYYFMAFHGAVIAYAESMQTVADDIQVVKPTVCAAVPRFYEKVHTKILEKVEEGSAVKKKIFYWALEVGSERSDLIFKKALIPFTLRAAYFFSKLLVFNKIKKKMGGRIRFFISGGAPLARELAEFFFAADVLILEGYGLTETSPVMAVNAPDDFCFGTVGKPLNNVEIKIAEDGEIITKGPCVMKGYYKNPEATAEALQGGWFHTGDIGTFDNGFLKITDRKKDIIATSGGKKVSPQNIEAKILADNLFLQAVLLGDKRNYLVALIVPNRTLVERQAQSLGISGAYAQLLKDPKIFKWVDERFRRQTQDLASYEQIKYFALLENEFTQAGGELTPTMKCKRRFIMEKYKDVIEELYQRKPESISSAS